MDAIDFTKEERAFMVAKLQAHLQEAMELDAGQFETEFLLKFIESEIGVVFYNRGLLDAQAVLSKQVDNIADAIYQLEKPTGASR
jgi:uncharacterized protein (DUF2164 family)